MLTKRKLKYAIVVPFCVLVFIAAALSVLLGYAKNYNKIDGAPRAVAGVMDYTGVSFARSGTDIILGEWEFFYNDWIVTDQVERAPDGYISLPASWEGQVVDGKKLSRNGYASYRLTIKGMSLDRFGIIGLDKFMSAYRTFVNGKLHLQYGYPAKNAKDVVLNDEYTYIDCEFNGKEVADIVIVFEVAANDIGGYNTGGMHVGYSPLLDNIWDWTESLGLKNHDKQGIFAMITIVSIWVIGTGIMLALKNKNWYLHSLFLLLAAFYMLFSRECEGLFAHLWRLPGYSFYLMVRVQFVVMVALLVCWIFVLAKERAIALSPKNWAAVAGYMLLVLGAYFVTFATRFQLLYLVLIDAFIVFWLVRVSIFSNKNNRLGNLYSIVLCPLFITFNAVELDMMGHLGFTMDGIELVCMLVFASMFCFVFLFQIKNNYQIMMQYAKKQKELERVKYQYNRAQVKPEFVNGMLDAIVESYYIGKDEGDEMLIKFSKHLRRNIDAESHDMVPFSEELENAQDYFDLENARVGHKMQLIFDIEADDFEVPILCLQSFIEYAIMIVRQDSFANPEITISSELLASGIEVKIKCEKSHQTLKEFAQESLDIETACKRIKNLLGKDVVVFEDKKQWVATICR